MSESPQPEKTSPPEPCGAVPTSPPASENAPIIIKTTWAKAFLGYRWPLAVVVICVLGFLLWREIFPDVKKIIKGGGRTMVEMARGFRQGTINTTFRAAIPTLSRDRGGNLELTSHTATETFKREDNRRVFWDYISLGTTVTEIRVPVTYRYYVRLRDDWQIDVEGKSCLVRAPAVRAFLPPAIHTDKLEKHAKAGWLRFNGQAQLDKLERGMTPQLKIYATDELHLAAVREQCRLSVAEFIKDWLLREKQWDEDRFSAIRVIFADEEEDTEGGGPTITIYEKSAHDDVQELRR